MASRISRRADPHAQPAWPVASRARSPCSRAAGVASAVGLHLCGVFTKPLVIPGQAKPTVQVLAVYRRN